MDLVGDEDGILKCNEMIGSSFKDFQVCYPVYYPTFCLIR